MNRVEWKSRGKEMKEVKEFKYLEYENDEKWKSRSADKRKSEKSRNDDENGVEN